MMFFFFTCIPTTNRYLMTTPNKLRKQYFLFSMQLNVNVNVHVYSPDIPVGPADCTIYTPAIGTHSFTVISPLGRIQHLRTLLQL